MTLTEQFQTINKSAVANTVAQAYIVGYGAPILTMVVPCFLTTDYVAATANFWHNCLLNPVWLYIFFKTALNTGIGFAIGALMKTNAFDQVKTYFAPIWSPGPIRMLALAMLIPMTLGLTGCPALIPLAIEAAPSIIETVETLVKDAQNKPATVAQVQTALNALQTIPVVANQVPQASAIQTALTLAGTPQLAPALSLPYQRAALDAQNSPQPQVAISNTIVTAQGAIK